MWKTGFEEHFNIELVNLEDGTWQVDGAKRNLERVAIEFIRQGIAFDFDGEILTVPMKELDQGGL